MVRLRLLLDVVVWCCCVGSCLLRGLLPPFCLSGVGSVTGGFIWFVCWVVVQRVCWCLWLGSGFGLLLVFGFDVFVVLVWGGVYCQFCGVGCLFVSFGWAGFILCLVSASWVGFAVKFVWFYGLL